MAAFTRLGNYLLKGDEQLNELIARAKSENAWFTPEATSAAIQALGLMLNGEDIEKWFKTEFGSRAARTTREKAVGLILAGNIPLVGFHDVLTVLAAGHRAKIKLSSHDKLLIPFILDKLVEIEPGFSGAYELIGQLEGFDAVIATGSTNSSRYFDYYFSKVPNIIRKNRNSIAILTGRETREQLGRLGHDIFDYFGLGCRNVSKVFVPREYDFIPFFESIEHFHKIIDHHKYNNNYDYNKSILLVNDDKHLDNGFLLLKEDKNLSSPLAVLYFQEYDNTGELRDRVAGLEEQLQCVVTTLPVGSSVQQVDFGDSQHPRLWDYADNINTAAFLNAL